MQKDLNISIDSNDRKLKYSHSNNLIPLSGMVEYTPNIGYCKIENRGRIDLINDNQKLLKCRSEREIATPNRNSLMFDNLKILKQKNFEPQHLYVDVEWSSLNKSLNKQGNKNTHQLRYQTKYRMNNGYKKIDEKRMTQDYSNLQSSKNLICKSLEGFSFKGNSTTNFKEMKSLFKQNNSKNQNIVYQNKEIFIIPSNKKINDCKLDINLYAEDNWDVIPANETVKSTFDLIGESKRLTGQKYELSNKQSPYSLNSHDINSHRSSLEIMNQYSNATK